MYYPFKTKEPNTKAKIKRGSPAEEGALVL